MTVLQITPGLPLVWGPYKEKIGSRYFTAEHVAPSLAPYLDRLGICWHLVNYTNVGGTAAAFHRNHLVPPGDKVSGSGSLYGTCYHGIIDGYGNTVVSLDETAGPNSAGTVANQRMIHMVLLMGDWTKQDERHERTLEAAAQFAATACVGFGIPNRWHNVYGERDAKVGLQRALELTNDTRTKVGQFAHRDITAAYQRLMQAGMTAKAAPWKNSHGDCGSAFPSDRLITRTQQIIEGDTMYVTINGDLAAFSIRGGIATWIESPGQRQRMQDDGSLPKTAVAWDISRLRDYVLVGQVPADAYPGITKITAAHFAGYVPAPRVF